MCIINLNNNKNITSISTCNNDSSTLGDPTFNNQTFSDLWGALGFSPSMDKLFETERSSLYRIVDNSRGKVSTCKTPIYLLQKACKYSLTTRTCMAEDDFSFGEGTQWFTERNGIWINPLSHTPPLSSMSLDAFCHI